MTPIVDEEYLVRLARRVVERSEHFAQSRYERRHRFLLDLDGDNNRQLGRLDHATP
jgi:hypothetical protein